MKVHLHLRWFLLTVPLLILVLVAEIQAAIPNQMSYQAKVTDSDGVPLSGPQVARFLLYTETTGGTPLWQEEQTVEVNGGVIQVQLGAGTPFAGNEFENDSLFLEIAIFKSGSGWETLSPRQELASTAFTHKAANSDAVGGLNLAALDNRYVNEGNDVVTSSMITDGAITTPDLSNGAVVGSKIAANAIDSGSIVDGSITGSDLAANSVGASELADNSVTSSAIISGAVTANHLASGAAIAEILDDDGTGSKLDADLLDGHDSAYFMTAATDRWVDASRGYYERRSGTGRIAHHRHRLFRR